jgi:membrane protease YdiL (CAAX protease family)
MSEIRAAVIAQPGDAKIRRRRLLAAAPVMVLATMLPAYRLLAAALGPVRGYLAGFSIYWLLWCLLFPLSLCGWQQVRRMFRVAQSRAVLRTMGGLALLLWPLPIAYAVALPAALPQANLATVGLSVVIAAINGVGEEILWRGTYLAVFGERTFLGYVWPAFGFAVWHYAPQVVFPNRMPGGATSLVLFSLALGLGWGWVARRTRSILWTTIAHVLLDAAGLGGRIYLR